MRVLGTTALQSRVSPRIAVQDNGKAQHLRQQASLLLLQGELAQRGPGLQPHRSIRCQAEVASGVDPWQRARDTHAAGTAFEGYVRGVNRGGVLVNCWGVSGFIPNSMVSPAGRPEEGQKVRALFVEVDELQNRMILSQRQLLQAELLKTLEVGSEVQGKVSWIEAYGAFVDIALPDGRTASGLVHKSELSWGMVIVPETVVSVGEWVKCKVLDVDPPRGRVALSIRQTQPDPLKQSLASILVAPDGSNSIQWKEADAPLKGLEEAVLRLQEAPGVAKVELGRQGMVQGHASQELELWLGRESEAGEFGLVARSGTYVQKLRVESSISKDEMKVLLDQVMKDRNQPAAASTEAQA